MRETIATKIWLDKYPSGVPAEIDSDIYEFIPDIYEFIPDMFEKTAAKFSGRPAFHNLGHTLSYAEVERLSRNFAAYLQGLPGVRKGDRVAVMSPNLLQYPVALFGILRSGMVLVNVNPLFNALLHTPGFKSVDFGALKVVVGGGAAVQESVSERWKATTGTYISEAYGLTESSPGLCGNLLETPWNGSVGYPLPSTEVSIRDEDFNELRVWTGEGDIEAHTGEVCARGPQVMVGYWNNAEETANTLRDGWLKTGDVGYMDEERRVTITDRKKDMIVRSGFNVYPAEIEGVIAAHPGVIECGVVGVPDEKSGETVRAVIVKKDPGLTKEGIIEHCRGNLTGYKIARDVLFRDELPKTPVGKILRRKLRDI